MDQKQSLPITEKFWNEYIQLEPRLLELYNQAKVAGSDNPCFCAMEAWDGVHWEPPTFKERLTELVGWFRHGVLDSKEKEVLHTSKAFDICYTMILYALPPCRKCSGHQTEEYLGLRDSGEDVSDWC
jgi:hypothetical protein